MDTPQNKILLISPPWSYKINAIRLIARQLAINLPLGLLYIASVAESENWQTKVLDCDTENISAKNLLAVIKNFTPDVIGFTVTTPCFTDVAFLAREIKKSIKAPIIIGGPHPTLAGKESLSDCFDFAFRGEGEAPLRMFLRSLKDKKRFSDIPGLVYRDGNQILVNEQSSSQRIDLDELSAPSRHLLKTDNYKINVPGCGKRIFTSILTSRGCPFECIFCNVRAIHGQRLRFRSPSLIVAEIKDCIAKYGITHFIVLDDTMTVNRKNMTELCDRMISERLHITWEGWTRVDCVDETLLAHMKAAGLVRISFGVETGNEKIMKTIKKNITREQIHRAFAISRRLSIESRCSLMIGHPGETKKTAWETIRFVRNEKNILYSTLSIAVPYPGTELERMASEGLCGLRLLSKDTSKYLRYFSPVMEVNDLNRHYLRFLQTAGLLWIHLTPKRIYYSLRRFGIINISASVLLMTFSFVKNIFFPGKKHNKMVS